MTLPSLPAIFDALDRLTGALYDLPDPDARLAVIEEARARLAEASPLRQPVDHVRWVPVEQVEPNAYNPNAVAPREMGLLAISIRADGYTQPVVTVYDPERDRYVIVDGFHRYFTAKTDPEIRERNRGRVPIVVIEKDLAERMASTVRHNRARGSHSLDGMASLVFSMLDEGRSDAEICNELGMEPEELVRLKHVTGFSKLFEDAEYSRAWETRHQIRLRTEAGVPILGLPPAPTAGPEES